MGLNLRLSDEDADALRRCAEEEGRSPDEIAHDAIVQYVSARPSGLRSAIQQVRTVDAELLDRLSD